MPTSKLVSAINSRHIQPALTGPRLLTGRDLIVEAKLTPGPIFAEILEELEAVQVEGLVGNRQEALTWLAEYLAGRPNGPA